MLWSLWSLENVNCEQINHWLLDAFLITVSNHSRSNNTVCSYLRIILQSCVRLCLLCLFMNNLFSAFPVFLNFSRHAPSREPINPYYVNSGYAMAPATSANDSEQQSMSSDADTVSLTDSSVYVLSHHTHIHKHAHFIHKGHSTRS